MALVRPYTRPVRYMLPSEYQNAILTTKVDRVKRLVEIKADLSKIPNTKFPISEGKDGKSYIRVDFEIHITYHSGDTSYELVHDGVNYGAVKAEYV